eukprot:TRINITY_DN1682_c0_g1_i2.p5 TRINITY_DN1682_c0_g1~~TRINITY_DN1682_c0_g1_i2.p5  ORF type:complete len:161 (-),score=2.65 TRINITY_DN1682_c0_g1_i2:516-998(-)
MCRCSGCIGLLTQGTFEITFNFRGLKEISEARTMEKWALTFGVTPSAIIIEDQARNTIENALYCLELLKNRIKNKIVVVTSDFHLTRSRLLFETVFKQVNVGVQMIGCHPSVLSENENIEKICENEFKGTLRLQKLIYNNDFKIDWLRDRQRTHPHIQSK